MSVEHPQVGWQGKPTNKTLWGKGKAATYQNPGQEGEMESAETHFMETCIQFYKASSLMNTQ